MADGVVIDPDSDGVTAPAAVPDSPQAPPPDDTGTTQSPDAPPAAAGGTQGKGDDKTEKRVADTEAALKAKQGELTKASQELAAVKAARAEFERLSEKQASAKEAETFPADPWDDPAWAEKFNEDPAAAYRELQLQERSRHASLLEKALKDIPAATAAMLDQRLAPERTQNAELWSELERSVPGFKSMPPASQLALVKTVAAKMKPADTLEPPSGTGAGTGRRGPAPDPAVERSQRAEAQRKSLFGHLDESNSDAQLYPAGKPDETGV